MRNCFAIGIDPGFASIGYCVLEIGTPYRMVCMDVFRTKKNQTEKASTDNMERAIEITQHLEDLWNKYPGIKILCVESMSFPRNSSAAAKMAMCWGVIASFVGRHNIAVVQLGPQEVKKKVCGVKTATKEDIQLGVTKIFDHQNLRDLHKKLPKGLEEHIYDSAAVLIAAWDSNQMKLLRSMVKE